MWQELNEISENAVSEGANAAVQHEFETIVEQVRVDYEIHSGRKPSQFETNKLFGYPADSKTVASSPLNKALALSVIASLRIRKHLAPTGTHKDKKIPVEIPDVIFVQASDHAKLDRPLETSEKKWVQKWIALCDSAPDSSIPLQKLARAHKAKKLAQEKREKKDAAIKIQKIQRAKRTREELKEREAAALKIQNANRKKQAAQELERRKKETAEKNAAMTKIQAQARIKLAQNKTDAIREEKVMEHGAWKDDDAQSHLEELKQVKAAVAGLQLAVESVQSHAVNELKKTVDGMNALRANLQQDTGPRYMRTTHTNAMRRGDIKISNGKTNRIPTTAKPTPSIDPLVFGPPRPLPKRSKKPKRGNKQQRKRRGARRSNSPYTRGPRPKDKIHGGGYIESKGEIYDHVSYVYDLHGHRIPVPEGMDPSQFQMSLGSTIKGRPHYGVSEPIPRTPEFLTGMEGDGQPAWRSAGAKVRPSPPTNRPRNSQRSPPTHRGGRTAHIVSGQKQKHTSARMVAGLMGNDPGIQARRGWSLPRKVVDVHSIDFDHRAGVSPHLSSWVEYRLKRSQRDAIVEKRKEDLLGWQLNKRRALEGQLQGGGSALDGYTTPGKLDLSFYDPMDSGFDFNLDSSNESMTMDLNGVHPSIKKEFEHEANLMERLRRHDDESDGVVSPHRDLSARRPKPHFGEHFHTVLESEVEEKHGSAFGNTMSRRERALQAEEKKRNQQRLKGMFSEGASSSQSPEADELRRREKAHAEEVRALRQEMAMQKAMGMAGRMRMGNRGQASQNDEVAQLQAQLAAHQDELARAKAAQRASKMKYAMMQGAGGTGARASQAQEERLRRMYDEDQKRMVEEHQMELQRIQEEAKAHRQNALVAERNAKRLGLGNKLFVAGTKAKDDEAKRRIADDMARMHHEEMKKMKAELERAKQQHEVDADVQNMLQQTSKVSSAEAGAAALKRTEETSRAEMEDLHAQERATMQRMHDEELIQMHEKASKKVFGSKTLSKNELAKIKLQHEEEMNELKAKHEDDTEDLQLSFENEKVLIEHQIEEEEDRANHDAEFSQGLRGKAAMIDEPKKQKSQEEHHDEFAALLADMGHDMDDHIDDAGNGGGGAMEHHEFEGLLTQLESHPGAEDAAMGGLGDDEHHAMMDHFLDSFGEMEDYDEGSSFVTDTNTDMGMDFPYDQSDLEENPHQQMLRHHERSRQHEAHLTNTANKVDNVIGALTAASMALDEHSGQGQGYYQN